MEKLEPILWILVGTMLGVGGLTATALGQPVGLIALAGGVSLAWFSADKLGRKRCGACRESMDSEATRCPHCSEAQAIPR